ANHAHWRALGIGAEHAHDTGGDTDIDAAGDHRLLSFARTIGVHDLKFEAVLLEDAGKLADFRDRGVPIAALADRQLHLVLCRGGGNAKQCQCRKRACECRSPHRESSLSFLPLFSGLWLSGDALKWRFAAAAEASPIRSFRNDALI